MFRRGRPFRRTATVLTVAALVAACSGDDADEEPIEPIVTEPLAADDVEGTAPSDATSGPATTTDATSTSGPSTTANATTTTAVSAPSTTTGPTTTGPTTTEPTTTEPTTTTVAESIAVQELILSEQGLGSTRFGADPDGVITYVASILGSPTDDTDWVDPFTFADCSFANEARRVDWGVLSLIFTDVSQYASGRRHFIGWEYGLVGALGDEPQGLRTDGGITLGSRVVDLVAEFPDVVITEGDESVSIPAGYFLNDEFNGLLTGVEDDDVVTVMTGGVGCFSG